METSEEVFKINYKGDIQLFKEKALHWANSFTYCCLLDSNNRPDNGVEWLLAVDAIDFCSPKHNAHQSIQQFIDSKKNTVYGYFSYDVFEELNNFKDGRESLWNGPSTFFFEPRYVLKISENNLTINRRTTESLHILESIENTDVSFSKAIKLESQFEVKKDNYIQQVNAIKERIIEGDFYECNYCVPFIFKQKGINEASLFLKLNKKNESPFSAYFKCEEQYVMCSSPERFLQKNGLTIKSQPIKGTIKKSEDKEENDILKDQLRNSIKEQAENVMIVDLVRNDLSVYSKAGTVDVKELFGIYEFKRVNHMISTIEAELIKPEYGLEAHRAAFPMGSMTGAPKHEVMRQTISFEAFKRGVYSGCIGYINQHKDYDFNVVIRSIFSNRKKETLYYWVGSAITFDSNAEKEWEELKIKANPLLESINESSHL